MLVGGRAGATGLEAVGTHQTLMDLTRRQQAEG
jgi:hypothetical protein